MSDPNDAADAIKAAGDAFIERLRNPATRTAAAIQLLQAWERSQVSALQFGLEAWNIQAIMEMDDASLQRLADQARKLGDADGS